jgi:hypothetical protein
MLPCFGTVEPRSRCPILRAWSSRVRVACVVPGMPSTAICSGLPVHRGRAHPLSHAREPERYMRCKDCSAVRGYPYKRSHLIALRPTKITASDPPSTWWPGER